MVSRRLCRRLILRLILLAVVVTLLVSIFDALAVLYTGSDRGGLPVPAVGHRSVPRPKELEQKSLLRQRLWALANEDRRVGRGRRDAMEEKEYLAAAADGDLGVVRARDARLNDRIARVGGDGDGTAGGRAAAEEPEMDEYMRAMLDGGNAALQVAQNPKDLANLLSRREPLRLEEPPSGKTKSGGKKAGAAAVGSEDAQEAAQFFDGKVHIPMETRINRNAVAELLKTNTTPDASPTVDGAFLFPILTYGANNQLRGLFETIAIARRLNRTLVIPDLFNTYGEDRVDGRVVLPPPTAKDGTWGQEQDMFAVYPLSLLYDTESIRSIVPTATVSDFVRACGGTIDTVVMTRSLESAHNQKNLRWRLNHYGLSVKRIVMPAVAKLPFAHPNVFDFSPYRSERCLALGLPYHSFPVQEMPEFEETECIMQPSTRIVGLAEDFLFRQTARIRARFRIPLGVNVTFLAVHLRRGARWTPGYCREFYPDEYAACYPSVVDVVSQVDASMAAGGHVFVYLSTASRNRTEMGFITTSFGQRLVRVVQSLEKDRVLRNMTSAEFSLFEQAVCTRAPSFLGTAFSTWTATVARWRKCQGRSDAVLFNAPADAAAAMKDEVT